MIPAAGLVLKDNILAGAATVGLGLPTRYRVPIRRQSISLERLLQSSGSAHRVALDPLAYGASGYNPFVGSAHHPWWPGYLAGGSSGHVAVDVTRATSSGANMLGIGSDTGGSVRIPAAYCGIFGLKLTTGLLSDAVFPLAPGLDAVGLLAAHSRILENGLRDLGLADDCLSSSADGRDDLKILTFSEETLASFGTEPAVVRSFIESLDALSSVAHVMITSDDGAADAWSCIFDAKFDRGLRTQSAQPLRAVLDRLDRETLDAAPSLARLKVRLKSPTWACPHAGRCELSVSSLFQWVKDFAGVLLLPTTSVATPPKCRGDTDSQTRTRCVSHLSLFANITGAPALTIPSAFGPLQLIGAPRSEHRLVRVGAFLSEKLPKPASRPGDPFVPPRMSAAGVDARLRSGHETLSRDRRGS